MKIPITLEQASYFLKCLIIPTAGTQGHLQNLHRHSFILKHCGLNVVKMFRASVTRRWQKTAKSAAQDSSDATRSKGTDSKSQKRASSVQWAIDLHKAIQRKRYSESQREFDKALMKLAEVSTMLERSAMLERGFEKDLRTIQDKLQIGNLPVREDAEKKNNKTNQTTLTAGKADSVAKHCL